MSKELVDYARAIADANQIDFDKVLEVVCDALAVTIRRKYDGERLFRVEIDPETYEERIYRIYKVVETTHYPTKEISLEAAQIDEPDIQVGDEISDLEENEQIVYDRVSYATLKQIMTNRVRDLKRDKIISNYEPYLGAIVYGRVKKANPNVVTIDLPQQPNTTGDIPKDTFFNDSNSIEATILKEGIIPTEISKNKSENPLKDNKLKTGEIIPALFLSVQTDREHNSKRMLLSRSHPDFLKDVIANEIPEVEEGIIEIVKIVREPGIRAKVAVRSNDKKLDLLGACIGPKSIRVDAIVAKVSGERVDFIEWSDDPATYIRNALAQKETQEIVVDETKQTIDVVVKQEFLSAAIGRAGVNVRLASRLLDKKIKVYSEEDYATNKLAVDESTVKYFEDQLGLDKDSAQFLVNSGFTKVEELAAAEIEELEDLVDTEQAQMLKDIANQALEKIYAEQLQFIKDANVEDRLIKLDGITNDILISLIKKEIKTLEDLADLASDELEPFMNKKIADSLIMQARNIAWFNNEEA